MSERSYHGATSRSICVEASPEVNPQFFTHPNLQIGEHNLFWGIFKRYLLC